MALGCFGKRQPDEPIPVLTERQKGAMDRLCKVSEFMDFDAITICGKGIGFDGILGLVLPEVGDCITAVVAFYVMANVCVHFNEVFRRNWATMTMNIMVDLIIGLIPLAGDLCDFYWHSYAKNTNIVRAYYDLEPLEEFVKKQDEAAYNATDSETGAAVVPAKKK